MVFDLYGQTIGIEAYFLQIHLILRRNLLMNTESVLEEITIIEAWNLFCLIGMFSIRLRVYIRQPHHSNMAEMLLHTDTQSLFIKLRQIFIAIQHQNPVIGRLRCSKIAGCAEIINPCEIIDFICITGGYLSGIICRTGIHYNNLPGISAQCLETVLNIFLFILCNDAY